MKSMIDEELKKTQIGDLVSRSDDDRPHPPKIQISRDALALRSNEPPRSRSLADRTKVACNPINFPFLSKLRVLFFLVSF